MKILYKAPGEPLRSMVIPNELGVMQQLVDGYIEPITLPDGTEEEYPSMAEAQRQLGCSQGRISDACLGKIKTYHHGRKWRFKDATA